MPFRSYYSRARPSYYHSTTVVNHYHGGGSGDAMTGALVGSMIGSSLANHNSSYVSAPNYDYGPISVDPAESIFADFVYVVVALSLVGILAVLLKSVWEVWSE